MCPQEPLVRRLLASRIQSVVVVVARRTQWRFGPLEHTDNTAAMSNKAKPGAEDEEKQSPTDLQEIQLQMNATTDEVMTTIIITAPFIAARRQLSPREAEASVTSVQLVYVWS